MSYDISLCDPVTMDTLETENNHCMAGGTYQIGGTKEMWLNVTWNYGWIYRDNNVFGKEGIRAIYNKTGLESIPILEKAIQGIKDNEFKLDAEEEAQYEKQGISKDSYWYPSKENAMRPLYQLLTFAKMRPDGIWDGD